MRKLRIFLAAVKVVVSDPIFAISFSKNLFLLFSASIRREKYVVIALTEHLGDIVATEPVARYLKEVYPYHSIWWATEKKYRSIIKRNDNISRCISVSCFTEWIFLKRFFNKQTTFDLHINNKECGKHHFINVKPNPFDITIQNYYHKGNLLYAFSRSAAIEMPCDIAPQLYFAISRPLFDGPYIVLHTEANDPARNWTAACWNIVVDYVLKHYPYLKIIEIGFQRTCAITNSRLIDYHGEKTYNELAQVIANSILFMGVDSSFAHFANALQKEALILIGHLSEFSYYMPYSGKYLIEKENTIHYFDGKLQQMPCDSIFDKLNQKLKRYRS